MVQLNPLNVAALALYTTSAMALPQPIYGPVLEAFGYGPKYAQLKPTKAQGVYPTQPAAPTGTEVVALPTGYYPVPTGGLHPGYPVPTGGFHPGYKQYGLAKRDDKDDEHDNSEKHDEKKKKHDKHNGSKKHDDKKKKKHRKPQGLAAPTGTGSFPIPTGSVSDEDTLEGTQERQFGAIRQRDFKPHWAGSPSEDEFPEPTGAGVAAPTGTGGLSPGKHGKHGKHEKHEKDGKHGKHEKDGKPEKDGKHGKHEKDEQDEQPAIVARSNDDEASDKKHVEKDVEKDGEKEGEKHGEEKKDKSDKKHGEKNDEKHSEKKDKKKAGKKHRKPQGLAPPTGTGGFPMPTGGFPPGVLPAGVSDGTDEGIQKRHFGGVRQHGFKPHWAGSHKGGYPAPTGTSPPSPTGTGHY